VRGALQILIGAGDAGEAVFNLTAARLAQGRWALSHGTESGRLCAGMGDLADVVAEGGGGGNPAGGGVRLLQQARLAQRGHHIAQGCGTEAFLVGKKARNPLRGHGFAGGNVQLDDGRKHQPLSRTEARIRHLSCSPGWLTNAAKRELTAHFSSTYAGKITKYPCLILGRGEGRCQGGGPLRSRRYGLGLGAAVEPGVPFCSSGTGSYSGRIRASERNM